MKIEIKNLTKIYGNNKAVNDLTLTLNDGIYGILSVMTAQVKPL